MISMVVVVFLGGRDKELCVLLCAAWRRGVGVDDGAFFFFWLQTSLEICPSSLHFIPVTSLCLAEFSNHICFLCFVMCESFVTPLVTLFSASVFASGSLEVEQLALSH